MDEQERTTRSGPIVLVLTGLLVLLLVGLGAQGWFDFALLGLTGVALSWGALRLARFVRDHGDEIGEARFDTRNKD